MTMEATTEVREFKGIWIPAELYLDLSISWEAKAIWAEIDSFSSKSRECFFGNEHLAERLGLSERSVRRHIAQLKDAGLIVVRIEGSRRFMHTERRTILSCEGGQNRPGKADKYGRYKSIKSTIPKEGIADPSGSVTKEAVSEVETPPSELIAAEPQIALALGDPSDPEKAAFQLCVDVWYNLHKSRKFTGVDGKKLKSIISRIVHYMKAEGKADMLTPENITVFFQWMVTHPGLSSFMRGAQLSVFDSQFDKTVFELRYGKKQDNYHSQNSASRMFGKYKDL